MSNDLIQNNDMTSTKINGMPFNQLEQNGQKNINITNNQGGTVNLNIHDSSSQNHETEDLMAVQAFSKVYYQLLVTDVLVGGSAIIPANRSLLSNMVPIEIFESCSELSNQGKEKLETFPAIVCRRNTEYYGKTSLSQSAWYCRITGILVEGNVIRVLFHSLGSFEQNKLGDQQNASYFGINTDCMLTDLNLTGWYVHKVNIFNAFDKAGISVMPRPD